MNLQNLDKHVEELILELLEEYEKDIPTNQYKIAKLERKVWSFYSINRRDKGDKTPLRRSQWFVEIGAKNTYGPAKRAGILLMGDLAKPLWDAIAVRKMPLATAYVLGKKAKGDPTKLKEFLEEYFSDKYIDYPNKDGYIHRRRPPKKPKSKKTKPSIPEINPEDLRADNARMFYASIKALTDTFVNVRLEGIEPDVRRGLVEDFEYEVRVTYEDLLKKIRNLRRDFTPSDTDTITVTAIRNACETLGISRPRGRHKVDIKRARSVYKRLAARYHPDRNNGSDKLVKQYHAVNEAWEVVELWNEQMEK
jgi:hypothetical protein